MPASCGIVSASMSSPSRGRPDSIRRHSAASSETCSTSSSARSSAAARRAITSTPRSVRHVAARARPRRSACSSAGGVASSVVAPRARSARGARARRSRPPTGRRGRACRSRACAQHRRGRSARCRARTEVLAAQDAQVGAQLALVVEDRRVAAAAGRERLHVVGDLALEEVDRLAAAQRELGALGAVDQAGGLGDAARSRWWRSQTDRSHGHGQGLLVLPNICFNSP